MTSGADEDLAHAWVDFFIQKSTQELMNERYGYGTVTHESSGLDYADRLNWLQPAEDFEWRNRVWNEVKASKLKINNCWGLCNKPPKKLIYLNVPLKKFKIKNFFLKFHQRWVAP